MESFSQKQRNFEVRAALSEAFVEYRLKKIGQEVQAFIPYEQLSSDITGHTEKTPFLLFLAAVHLIGFVATAPGSAFESWPWALLLGGGALIYGWMYFHMRHKLLMLKGQNYNVCVLNNAEGRGFLEALRGRRKEYMRMMYGRIRWENSVTDELGRFRYLNTQGILSDAEYEAIRVELMNK